MHKKKFEHLNFYDIGIEINETEIKFNCRVISRFFQ